MTLVAPRRGSGGQDSWRIGVDVTERTALVTSGPFGVVRNPIFTSMLITSLGLSFAVPNALSFPGVGRLRDVPPA